MTINDKKGMANPMMQNASSAAVIPNTPVSPNQAGHTVTRQNTPNDPNSPNAYAPSLNPESTPVMPGTPNSPNTPNTPNALPEPSFATPAVPNQFNRPNRANPPNTPGSSLSQGTVPNSANQPNGPNTPGTPKISENAENESLPSDSQTAKAENSNTHFDGQTAARTRSSRLDGTATVQSLDSLSGETASHGTVPIWSIFLAIVILTIAGRILWKRIQKAKQPKEPLPDSDPDESGTPNGPAV